MSSLLLERAQRLARTAAETAQLRATDPQRVARAVLEHKQMGIALYELAQLHTGYRDATASLIDKAYAMREVISSAHAKLVNGTQDHWKTELPIGKSPEFRTLLRDFFRLLKKIESGD